MYTVEEVSKQLKVSKVTIYSKLKKFDTLVVLKQGKKYITDDFINLNFNGAIKRERQGIIKTRKRS